LEDRAPTPAGPVLDAASLDRLRELGAEIGDFRFLEKMAGTFLECMPSIESLRRKIAEADLDAVVDLAHSLRGNSASFGALRLAELAAELEARAGRGELAEPWPRWDEIVEEHGRVRAELQRLAGS
jgi:HPt (histidine-containing phosphotransfer) domain-containing protein